MSNSKLMRSGGERRITRQMTATRLDSLNPLRIPEMLENILGFLTVEDLKTCRLVNKFWKESALKPMRKKCKMITFEHSPPEYPRHGLEVIERFLECFIRDGRSGLLSDIRDDIPCTKLEIFTSIFDGQKSDRDKSILANFFQSISPWVTEIAFQEERDNGHLLNGMEELKFPSLKRIVFADTFVGHWTHTRAFSPWMSVFIHNSPQLKKISFSSENGYKVWDYPDTSLQQFLQALEQNRKLEIQSLDISAQIENNDLIRLSESDWKLKHLKLRKRKFPQQRIAFRHLETLEICDYDLSVPANEDVHFPIMENLKSLTLVHSNCPGLINHVAQTPSLETVVFEMWSGFDWPSCLSREIEPAPSVKELNFQRDPPTFEAMLEAVRIFPNISKLELVIHNRQVPLPVIYDSLPNLKELTLNIPPVRLGCVEGLLTGLSKEGCQDALRKLRYWTPNFDASDIQIGRNHSPISVLKNLKLLRLRTLWSWPRKLEISKVSLCLALMKMPSLQTLDLCERSIAPDELIPKSVLKEFRKNRLILWKLKD